jgi:hypothetical protein
MRTDRPTDRRRNMTKLTVAFRSFTNVPNKNEMTAVRESSVVIPTEVLEYVR